MAGHEELYREVADVTVQVRAGASRGSGFYLLEPDLVVTNWHVTSAGDGKPALPRVEIMNPSRQWVTADLVCHSIPFDYAVYRSATPNPAGASLSPSERTPAIGLDTCIAGFPHGIDDLLVQGGHVAGALPDQRSYYVDVPVNGGNSGGPLIETVTGHCLGIVTSRRFIGESELTQMAAKAQAIVAHCRKINQGGSVQIMGVDFGQFAGYIAETNVLLRELMLRNANTGIGIAGRIDECLADIRTALG